MSNCDNSDSQSPLSKLKASITVLLRDAQDYRKEISEL